MPTYTYQCSACEHEFEREQRITEDPIKRCPKCGKLKAHRTITNGNFILKGGGWYADGYGSINSHNRKPEPSSTSSSTSQNGASSSSSESSKKESKKTESASATAA